MARWGIVITLKEGSLGKLTLSLYHQDEGSYSTVQLVLRTPTGGVAAPQATYYVPATVLLSVRT